MHEHYNYNIIIFSNNHESFSQIMKSIFLHPFDYCSIILSKENVVYFILFSAPLFYLHWLRPKFILVYFFFLMAVLIFPKPEFYKAENSKDLLSYPYSGILLSIFFVESILNFKIISTKIIIRFNSKNIFPNILACLMLIFSIFFYIKYNKIYDDLKKEYPYKKEIYEIRSLIPRDETVLVSWSFCNYFSFFYYPYTFIGFSVEYTCKKTPKYIVVDYKKIFPYPSSNIETKNSELYKMKQLIIQNKLDILYEKNSLYLLRIKEPFSI